MVFPIPKDPTRPPCIEEKCLKYPICKHKTELDCDLLGDWIIILPVGERDKLTKEEAKESKSRNNAFLEAFPRAHTISGTGFIKHFSRNVKKYILFKKSDNEK